MNGQGTKGAASLEASAAQGNIDESKPITAAAGGQGRSGPAASGSGQGGRRGKVSATEASRFWRTVNVGERIEQAGGGA